MEMEGVTKTELTQRETWRNECGIVERKSSMKERQRKTKDWPIKFLWSGPSSRFQLSRMAKRTIEGLTLANRQMAEKLVLRGKAGSWWTKATSGWARAGTRTRSKNQSSLNKKKESNGSGQHWKSVQESRVQHCWAAGLAKSVAGGSVMRSNNRKRSWR